MGTVLLFLALFMQEIGMNSTNDTLLKVFALTLCITTWFAAFQYWNSFIREFSVQMTKAEVNEYKEYEESYYEGYNEDYDEGYNEPEKVELDSPVKRVCKPFTVEHPEKWMKDAQGSWGNGYVLISSDHPWSGRDADHIEHSSLQEITFSGTFGKDTLQYAGFEKEIYENADQYWVFGFDTMHIYNSPINNKEWVRKESIQLADAFGKEFIEGVV